MSICTCSACRKARRHEWPAWIVVVALVVAGLILVTAIMRGQTTYEMDAIYRAPAAQDSGPFVQVEHRWIRNTTNTDVSRHLCGEDGHGIFFDSGDLQAGSCITVDPFHEDTIKVTLINGVVWVPMNADAGFYETMCYSEWANVCGRPPGRTLDDQCQRAMHWQAFSAANLQVYLGQAETLGGPLTPVTPRDFVCPILTVTATPVTPTALPVTTPLATPTALASLPPPTSCPGPVSQPAGSPTCYCAATKSLTACPGPTTAVPTHVPPTSVPISTATPAPAVPTLTPATPAPVQSPVPSPTTPPAVTSAPSPVNTITATPKPSSGGTAPTATFTPTSVPGTSAGQASTGSKNPWIGVLALILGAAVTWFFNRQKPKPPTSGDATTSTSQAGASVQ